MDALQDCSDRNEQTASMWLVQHAGVKKRARYCELHRTVEFLNVKQSIMLAQMECKQKLRIEVSQEVQTSIFQRT